MQRSSDLVPAPVVVGTIGVPELLTSGLTALLASHRDRVTIVTPDLLGRSPDDVPAIDVALCDTRDPTALSCVAELRRSRPLPVLEFVGVLGRPHLHQVAAQFEIGRLPIGLDAEGLIEALTRTARSGRAVLAYAMDGYAETAHLSPREVQILELVCSGLTNAEIATRLFLSINSVKTYIRTLYRKIGVTRRAQCVAWGMALERTGSWSDTDPTASADLAH